MSDEKKETKKENNEAEEMVFGIVSKSLNY